MSDRIRELAEQAGCTPRSMESGAVRYMHADGKLEDFAKLLIEDCLNVMTHTAQEADRKGTYMGDDVPTFAHQYAIRRHFGLVPD